MPKIYTSTPSKYQEQQEDRLFKLIAALKSRLEFKESALSIDLNSRFNNYDRFEYDLRKLMKHLNEFAFGRAYLRNEKKLNIVGVMEDGVIKTNLHVHMLITNLEATKRKLQELIAYIRKEWSKIIEINNPNGSMIEAEILKDHDAFNARFSYMTKFLSNQRIHQGKYIIN